jgi:pimeloyl-ACP methyl ester carboxylesterase
VRQILEQAGLASADLIGASVGGALAADVAAIWPEMVRSLVLLAPFGIFDDAVPPANPWAQRKEQQPELLCAQGERYVKLKEAESHHDPIEWAIEQGRADEAGARILWPLGDTRLRKRLPLIRAETLVLWGEQDRVLPPAYAETFKTAIGSAAEIRLVPDAGHMLELDQPGAAAEIIVSWLNRSRPAGRVSAA